MKQVTQLKNIDQFIDEAKRLRAQAEEAEAAFLLFVRAFELEREDLWKTAGVTTYEAFLTSSHVCNPARYRNFVAGTKVIDDAERVGAGPTIAAAAFKAPTEEAAREYVHRCDKFKEVHGVSASEQHAKTWVKQLDQAEPKVIKQASRLRQLEGENQALRAENRELKRKLVAAEKEITQLKKQAGRRVRKTEGAQGGVTITA